jgi:hypothetical protein
MNSNSTKSIKARVLEQPVRHESDAAQTLVEAMTQLGAATTTVSGLADCWPLQLKVVVARVLRMRWLDTMGQALAMHAYMIGVAAGLYGARSGMARDLRVNYEPVAKAYSAPGGRAARRVFETLMAAGELEGRERLCQSEFDAPLSSEFQCRTDMPTYIVPTMSSSRH